MHSYKLVKIIVCLRLLSTLNFIVYGELVKYQLDIRVVLRMSLSIAETSSTLCSYLLDNHQSENIF